MARRTVGKSSGVTSAAAKIGSIILPDIAVITCVDCILGRAWTELALATLQQTAGIVLIILRATHV